MPDNERRQHRRLPLRLPLAYRPAGVTGGYTGRAVTANLSTLGAYFESADGDFRCGMNIELALTVPPAEGISPYQTEIFATGEIVRCAPVPQNKVGNTRAMERAGVAVRFNRPLQYELPA